MTETSTQYQASPDPEGEKRSQPDPTILSRGILEQNLAALLKKHQPPTVLWVLCDLLYQKNSGWSKTVTKIEDATHQSVADEAEGAVYE